MVIAILNNFILNSFWKKVEIYWYRNFLCVLELLLLRWSFITENNFELFHISVHFWRNSEQKPKQGRCMEEGVDAEAMQGMEGECCLLYCSSWLVLLVFLQNPGPHTHSLWLVTHFLQWLLLCQVDIELASMIEHVSHWHTHISPLNHNFFLFISKITH